MAGSAPRVGTPSLQNNRLQIPIETKSGLRLQDLKLTVGGKSFETDSPYLAPVPHRGKSNLPQYVREVAEYLAVLRGVSLETLAEQTTANFKRLFPLARVAG